VGAEIVIIVSAKDIHQLNYPLMNGEIFFIHTMSSSKNTF
jgi:hypothetical protein